MQYKTGNFAQTVVSFRNEKVGLVKNKLFGGSGRNVRCIYLLDHDMRASIYILDLHIHELVYDLFNYLVLSCGILISLIWHYPLLTNIRV
jgi:hypothetical protein